MDTWSEVQSKSKDTFACSSSLAHNREPTTREILIPSSTGWSECRAAKGNNILHPSSSPLFLLSILIHITNRIPNVNEKDLRVRRSTIPDFQG
jgi:hypothetical protein